MTRKTTFMTIVIYVSLAVALYSHPAVLAKNGNKLVVDNVKFIPSDNPKSLIFENINKVENPK
ncbi:hypothetical protein JW935_06280 [candidate division KSB1 bacterium]|nr:hypothetical protein [candidate division KSB1 bacterium]